MISWLITTLVVPLLPELREPHEVHQPAMNTVMARLKASEVPTPIDPAQLVFDPPKPPQVSPVEGRLLAQYVGPMQAQVAAEDAQDQGWKLVGMLEVNGQLAAILNDGAQDFVAVRGSALKGRFRVVSVAQREVELSYPSRDSQRMKTMHLILDSNSTAQGDNP
ncbi:MAG: hypothetical protein ACK4FF_00260 [Limnobacter sp.]|uniref:hypothetical protein n=1 Tax=Limnobacter sp. TaxID=2003368 RepID=UPI00391CFA3A